MPVVTATLTFEFCEAPAPVFWLSACIPAKFWNALLPVVRLLSVALDCAAVPAKFTFTFET